MKVKSKQSNNEFLLREKISDYYTEIFEEKLIDEIVGVSHYGEVRAGDLLVDIGVEMTHIPLVLDGVIKILRQESSGDEILLYFLEKGDTCAISFVNCINKKKSIFKGLAESDVEAIFIPVKYVDKWLAKYKTWRYFIIDSYHFRLLEMVESLDGLAFMKMHDRLLKYLNDKVKVTKNIELEITHQEIADDMNTSRVVVTRVLKELQKERKIESTRNRVKLLDFK